MQFAVRRPSSTASCVPRPGCTSPRGRSRAIGVTAGLTVFALAACGGASDETTSATNADGGALYQSNCASCHGADLGGTEKGPAHLSIVYEPGHHGDDAFRSAIANGAAQHHWEFGNMPAVTGLDDTEVDAIIAYIRSEQERQGFRP